MAIKSNMSPDTTSCKQLVTERLIIDGYVTQGVTSDSTKVAIGHILDSLAVHKLVRDVKTELNRLDADLNKSLKNDGVLISGNLVSPTMEDVSEDRARGFYISNWSRPTGTKERVFNGTGLNDSNALIFNKNVIDIGTYFIIIEVSGIVKDNTIDVCINDKAVKSIQGLGKHIVAVEITAPSQILKIQASNLRVNDRVIIKQIGLHKASNRLNDYFVTRYEIMREDLLEFFKDYGFTTHSDIALSEGNSRRIYATKEEMEAVVKLIDKTYGDTLAKELLKKFITKENLQEVATLANIAKQSLDEHIANTSGLIDRINTLEASNVKDMHTLDTRYANKDHDHAELLSEEEYHREKLKTYDLYNTKHDHPNKKHYYRTMEYISTTNKVLLPTNGNWSTEPMFSVSTTFITELSTFIDVYPYIGKTEFKVVADPVVGVASIYYKTDKHVNIPKDTKYYFLIRCISTLRGGLESDSWTAIHTDIDAKIDTFHHTKSPVIRLGAPDNGNIILPMGEKEGDAFYIRGVGTYIWHPTSMEAYSVDHTEVRLATGQDVNTPGRWVLTSICPVAIGVVDRVKTFTISLGNCTLDKHTNEVVQTPLVYIGSVEVPGIRSVDTVLKIEPVYLDDVTKYVYGNGRCVDGHILVYLGYSLPTQENILLTPQDYRVVYVRG